MELIDEFKTKYPRYWSVWLHSGAALMGVLEILNQLGVFLPYLEQRVPPGVYVGLSLGFTVAGLIARAIKQSKLNPVQVVR